MRSLLNILLQSMKVAHKHTGPLTKHEWLEKAREAEDLGELEEAADAYEKVIAKDHLNEFAYNRLFIIYRKQKEYGKELDAINAGIEAYEKLYDSQYGKKPDKVSAISKKLNKAMGLTDKKGNSLYSPEPVGKWKRRKLVVEKRIKSQS
jgi:tetratricopeptide (TPR) repeat protein